MSRAAVLKKTLLSSTAQRFADDLNAALAGDESGRVYKYLYMDPRGSGTSVNKPIGLAKTLANSNHYYVFRNGLWLVNTYAQHWANAVGTGRPLIELGLGTGKALEKTKALVAALKPSKLIINDYSEEHLRIGETVLSNAFSGLAIQKHSGDFLAMRPGDIKAKAPVVVFQGCTLSNYDDIPGVLNHIMAVAGPGADVFVDFDTNQDVNNLKLAYGSPAQIEQRKQILRYGEDVFPSSGLKADDFRWQPEWRADQHLLLQKLVQKTDQSISIDGVYHSGPNSLVVSKMYKDPLPVFNEKARAGGVRVQRVYRDFEGKLAFAHLKAV